MPLYTNISCTQTLLCLALSVSKGCEHADTSKKPWGEVMLVELTVPTSYLACNVDDMMSLKLKQVEHA